MLPTPWLEMSAKSEKLVTFITRIPLPILELCWWLNGGCPSRLGPKQDTLHEHGWHGVAPITRGLPHTIHSYCREVEVHWLTNLFVAKEIRHKVDDHAMPLMELSELKEDMEMVKEALHQFGTKFRTCLFQVCAKNHWHSTPPTAPIAHVEVVKDSQPCLSHQALYIFCFLSIWLSTVG